jgi:hypothetical protein
MHARRRIALSETRGGARRSSDRVGRADWGSHSDAPALMMCVGPPGCGNGSGRNAGPLLPPMAPPPPNALSASVHGPSSPAMGPGELGAVYRARVLPVVHTIDQCDTLCRQTDPANEQGGDPCANATGRSGRRTHSASRGSDLLDGKATATTGASPRSGASPRHPQPGPYRRTGPTPGGKLTEPSQSALCS